MLETQTEIGALEVLGKSQMVRGQNVSIRAILGGGGTYYRMRPPKPVLEGLESGIGLVCAHSL